MVQGTINHKQQQNDEEGGNERTNDHTIATVKEIRKRGDES